MNAPESPGLLTFVRIILCSAVTGAPVIFGASALLPARSGGLLCVAGCASIAPRSTCCCWASTTQARHVFPSHGRGSNVGRLFSDKTELTEDLAHCHLRHHLGKRKLGLMIDIVALKVFKA